MVSFTWRKKKQTNKQTNKSSRGNEVLKVRQQNWVGFLKFEMPEGCQVERPYLVYGSH